MNDGELGGKDLWEQFRQCTFALSNKTTMTSPHQSYRIWEDTMHQIERTALLENRSRSCVVNRVLSAFFNSTPQQQTEILKRVKKEKK